MKAVIFDFNGTLYNDTHLHIAAWKSFFKKYFDIDYTPEEVHRLCIGPSNVNIFKNVLPGRLEEKDYHEYSELKEAEYRAAVLSDPKNWQLVKGATELFDWLEANGVPFAVATASPLGNVELYLETLNLKKWLNMDRIVYEDGKLPSKPDPAFYNEAARRLGLTPADCLIFEDSRTGIQAAINAKAGKLVALGHTAPMDWLKAQQEIHAIVDDFCGAERFI